MTPTNAPLPDHAITPEVTTPPAPDTPSVDTPSAPDPTTPESRQDSEPPATTSAPGPPALSLWELMRKDTAPTPSDAASRVLSNPRPSIWDID